MRPLWFLFVMTLAACSSGVNVAPPAADDDVSSLGADPPSGEGMRDDNGGNSDGDAVASGSDDTSSDGTRLVEAGTGASNVDVADEPPDDATGGVPADDDDAPNDDGDAIVQPDDAATRDNAAPGDDDVLDDEPSALDEQTDDGSNFVPDDVAAGKDAGTSHTDDTADGDAVSNPPECQDCVTAMEVTPELDGIKQHEDPSCGEYRVASLTKFLVTPETRQNESRFLILVRELLEDSTVGTLAVEVAEGHTLPDWLTLSVSPLGHVTLQLDEEFYGPGEAAADVWVQHSGDACPALLVPFELHYVN